MDVSNQDPGEPGGNELIQTLAGLAGLPSGVLENELEVILGKSGRSQSEGLTLDDLRVALAAHLEELMGPEAMASESEPDAAPSLSSVTRLTER
jgi:hypothetical protein